MTSASLSEPPSVPAPDAAARTRAGRRTLALLAFVCVLPVVASYFAYYVWQPEGRANYGELLVPAALPDAVLPGVAGQPDVARKELEGRWTLLFAASGACDRACTDALYLMRQSRLAQGEEMERVARLWLVSDAAMPAAELLAVHDGLRLARATPAWLAHLPAAERGRHVYLVDPRGSVIMRFHENADPRRVIKDLQRLLKYSALGRVQSTPPAHSTPATAERAAR
ncbi:hypothetical protein SAMN05421829_106168 [Aromatoleum tolulyticum]|uniref:Cytochrome oxidase Cu insertion factor, SCO1/SenC/PrrC family n=1 Tax=Aromatoleum tolulyticum TaxID=34027 RepID=A0A1N6V6G1_9RHOO|nr:hypothetical protein [Aromatoleum tolulyticum]SIQ73392.1 hypothetical protein SAMN05421829_106168 [Aromatoleum tolulyticum]